PSPPADTIAAWPSMVIRSRWPRALTRSMQNPFSSLWRVTRSTTPTGASIGVLVFIAGPSGHGEVYHPLTPPRSTPHGVPGSAHDGRRRSLTHLRKAPMYNMYKLPPRRRDMLIGAGVAIMTMHLARAGTNDWPTITPADTGAEARLDAAV